MECVQYTLQLSAMLGRDIHVACIILANFHQLLDLWLVSCSVGLVSKLSVLIELIAILDKWVVTMTTHSRL